jgi:glycosyltransferase involved in cell wall biosynthesis
MKILYISQYYPPETPAPAARASELGKMWAAAGQDVMVLTGFPNHPTGKVHPQYRAKLWRLFMTDDSQGVRVRRTWLIPLPNRKSWERMLNYFSFFLSAALRGIFLSRPDVVIASSPQLLVGLSGLIIAKWKRVPFIFEVRDLWPESLEAVGASGKNSFLFWALGRVAGLLYRKADHIVVVTNAFKPHLKRFWKVPPEKISVVINGVDHEFFEPQPANPALLQEFEIQGRFVVGYIGTIGNAHGVETLVEVAKLLQSSDPQIVFFVVGEGADKGKLEQLVAQNQLGNIKIFPGQQRQRIPAIIAASQVCLVLLKKSELFKTVIPTKMLEFMACGRPLVAALEGESAELIKNAGAGICVTPEDSAALTEAIRFIYRNPEQAQQFANSGREYVVKYLSRQSTADSYLALLKKVCQLAKKSSALLQSPLPPSKGRYPAEADNSVRPIGEEVHKVQ